MPDDDQPHHEKNSNRITRSAEGTWQKKTRDIDAWKFLAQQKYVRLDTLGEYLSPGYVKASKQAESQEPQSRGGNRQQRPWPSDQRHRMMAVQRLVARWQRMGVVEIWQPYKDQPAWVRLNQLGLAELHLDWPEILWPLNERWLRDDGKNWLSHTHRVNKMRLALARGEIPGIPAKHTWHSEREIELTLPARHSGVRLLHKVDGYITLEIETTWTRTRTNGNVVQVLLPPQTTIACELELTRKRFGTYQEIILPDLLRFYDYTVYLAIGDAYDAVVSARRKTLLTNEERRRIRILRFEPE
jgi:hypothetical protein